jgi:hypothetical protein
MEPFVVVSAHDEKVQIPFAIPMKDGETLLFSIPRLNFIDEAQARQMKSNLLELDKLVPQTDLATGEPMFEKGDDGEFVLNDAGEKIPVMGQAQMSLHEKMRAVSEAMLSTVVPPATYRKLQKLTVGELEQIVAHWTKVSSDPIDGVEPGESSASLT